MPQQRELTCLASGLTEREVRSADHECLRDGRPPGGDSLKAEKILFILILGALFVASVTADARSATRAPGQTTPRPAAPLMIPKFTLRKSGLELERPTRTGAFFDVVGKRSAVFGYEHRSLEAWAYPLKILDDFELFFRLEGYPLEFRGADLAVEIAVRPEATTFTYSHAAFTVRQIIFAPLDEPGIVMLIDAHSALPLSIRASFRPRLKLGWPAGLMTGNLYWDERERVYYISEETKRYVGIIGSPAAREASVMPYQEEPRDVPASLLIEAPSTEAQRAQFIPIIIAGATRGRGEARAIYDKLLGAAQSLYEKNVSYYERFQNETLAIKTPDERLDEAFRWAKVGIDKGMVTNPLLGSGLVAGYRTSGESERPGFAWFFGRDALWTALAINSYGDFTTTRTALEFLGKFQRADGKIPHEISQSATLVPWFTDYEYPWASADATPLYIIAHADYWRARGDRQFLQANWDSILKAYRFSAATDRDANGLIENTEFGHGWVEGGGLYPPHEEIYMQALWIEASRALAEMAEALKDSRTTALARAAAERTRAATEQSYWLPARGFYAFATYRPVPHEQRVADPGPNRAIRQRRMDELGRARIIDEDTVLPAVALWWQTLAEERAQSEIDHLGSGRMATDWGTRIISNESQLYDPLSYHHGSVWPLFTGWAGLGAYRYGRPHVGYQALMANALLTYQGALGYVTELLSGDWNAPFGRSSHHQIWSEAMVVTPLVRGLFGIEASAGGTALRFAPQLPANWDYVEARRVAAGGARYDLTLKRADGRLVVTIERSDSSPTGITSSEAGGALRITVAPFFPLDARVREVTAQGRAARFEIRRTGDVQSAEVSLDLSQSKMEVVFVYDEGTEVYGETKAPAPGAGNSGLRILRSHADANALRLVLEGLGGRSYSLRVRTPHEIGKVSGVEMIKAGARTDTQLVIAFDGAPDAYVRREIVIPLQRASR